ncbi:hypothetical protein [Gordonia malaquae]
MLRRDRILTIQTDCELVEPSRERLITRTPRDAILTDLCTDHLDERF